MGELVHLLIYLLIVGVIIALVFYVLSALPLPEPIAGIIRVVAVVVCCLILIVFLLQFAGGSYAIFH
jgi:hypothetical protein